MKNKNKQNSIFKNRKEIIKLLLIGVSKAHVSRKFSISRYGLVKHLKNHPITEEEINMFKIDEKQNIIISSTDESEDETEEARRKRILEALEPSLNKLSPPKD